MNVLLTGASGLIGQALIPFLTASGHQVTRLVRRQAKPGEPEVRWNPQAGTIDQAGLEGFDGVVHLAGENIAGRWTPAKKVRIRESRANGTRLLCVALAQLNSPPRVLVAASATGYYGDRGEEVLTEASGPGSLFLAEVCREGEAATEPAARAGIRVVNLRIGFVLSPKGGGLARMLPPFRMGLGGRIGSGRQYMSWIAIDDLVSIMLFAASEEALQGPVNAVAPNPVTNQEFTKILGHVLRRPTLFPLPAFVARFALGQMADELLLASARVQPARLLSSGYQFRFGDLEDALRHFLGTS